MLAPGVLKKGIGNSPLQSQFLLIVSVTFGKNSAVFSPTGRRTVRAVFFPF
jgi:hypothetical protein